MERPPRKPTDRVIDREMWLGIVWVGSVMAAVTLIALDLRLDGGFLGGDGEIEAARTMAFTTLVFAQRFDSAKGFHGYDLERIVDVITSDRKVWLDTMMREELGYGSDVTNPLRAAPSTLVAFVVVGFPPLGAFVYDLVMPGDVAAPFVWSAVLTGLAFLIVGASKARFVDQPAWRSALETLAVGGGAAVLACVVGAALQGVA